MLLALPPELFDLVISFLDTPSFAILLTTSQSVRLKILLSAHALHSHFRRLPGLHRCPSQVCKGDPFALLRMFNRVAADHAANGLSVLCDVTLYKSRFRTRYKLGQLERMEGHHDPYELVASVDADSAIVHIYSLQEGFPLPRYAIDPKVPYMEADRFEVQLLKLHETRGQKFISVLYKYTVLDESKSTPTAGNTTRRRMNDFVTE
jgi:hypothetical protein